MIDVSKVGNKEARQFLNQFLSDRLVNVDFYRRVPDDKFDFRMVDTPEKKSDSTRESLAHQIETENQYIEAIRSGKLVFGLEALDLIDLHKKSKDELLFQLLDLDQALVEMLSDPLISDRTVTVPWSSEPISVVGMLWGLDTHEVFHQGWNVAVMDHLNMERFPTLIQKWGP